MATMQFLVCLVLVSYATATTYNLEFEENGSKYNEKIFIDKAKGYLIYDVPQHGNIEASKFLKDFNIRMNVLKNSNLKICYIWKMKTNEPLPDSIEAGLKMVKGQFPSGKYLVENNEIYTGPKIPEDSLTPLIKKFCQGMQKLSIIHKSSAEMEKTLREEIMKSLSSGNKVKRSTVHYVNHYKLCPNARATMVKEISRCEGCGRTDLIRLNCDITYTRMCGYTVRRGMWSADCTRHPNGFKCRLPSHTRATVKCCRVKCLKQGNCPKPTNPPKKQG